LPVETLCIMLRRGERDQQKFQVVFKNWKKFKFLRVEGLKNVALEAMKQECIWCKVCWVHHHICAVRSSPWCPLQGIMIGRLKTTDIYFLPHLEAQGMKQRCWQD
jgi:hypothetical protein